MGKFSRDKGARVERDVARDLELLLGVKFERNLEQTRAADHGDLIARCDNFPFLIEVKARANGGFQRAWWSQAYTAALKTGQHPAVIYKFDRKPIMCRVQLRAAMECISRRKWSAEDAHVIDIDLEGFAYLVREGMA